MSRSETANKGGDNRVLTDQPTSGHERGNYEAAAPAQDTRAANDLKGHCLRRSNLFSSILTIAGWVRPRLSLSGRQLERIASFERGPSHTHS